MLTSARFRWPGQVLGQSEQKEVRGEETKEQEKPLATYKNK